MMRLTGCAACAWMTCAVWVWVGSAQGMETVVSQPETSIRLAFRGATIGDILDSLNRMSGLPVVLDAEVPAGTIDFVSPEDHDLESALRVLNTVLQSRDVTIRVIDGMLHLEKLSDMQRQDLPTFVGTLPAEVTPDTLVTVVRPLDSAMAEPVAKQLSQMVGEYGAVVAMVGQNAVVITETASNARRLLDILNALDQQDPDGVVEVFSVKNVAASSLIKPLMQLMTIKVEKYMPGKKGKLQKVEETSMEGLTFAADDHASLIIAKGSKSSLTKLGEVIRMLDVPGGTGGARTVRTIPLAVVSPSEAVKRLTAVVEAMPEEARPQMLALPERSSIVLTGSSSEVDELVAVLAAIEGDLPSSEAVAMQLLPLDSADPKAVQAALTGILSGSQRARVKIGLAPDGQSLLFSGPSSDVQAVSRMAEALDLGGADVPAIRTLRIRPESLGEVMQAYATLAQTHTLPEQVEMSVDAEVGSVRLVGEPADVSAMASLLQSLTETIIEVRETRQFVLNHVRPSRVGRAVAESARSLLSPSNGTPWTSVDVKDIDALDVLLVTAAPGEMDAISSIIDSLDRATPADSVVRVIPLRGAPTTIIDQADAAFTEMGGGGFGPPRPRVELDGSGDRLVLSGDREAVSLYEQALRRYLELAGPPRSTRVTTLRFAQPQEMATLLSDLTESRGMLLADGSMLPSIEAFEEVDGILVTGTDRQHQAIRNLLQTLDTEHQGDADVQVIQMKGTNASAVAMAVQSALAARAMFRPGRTVASLAAAPSETAILVTGTPDQIADVETIINALDTGMAPDDVQVRTVYLKLARAEQVAPMMTELLGQQQLSEAERAHRLRYRLPMPDETAGVRVAADERLNAIIVAGRGPELAAAAEMAKQLDMVAGEATASGVRGVQVLPVRNADPAELAASIEAIFAGTDGDRAPVVRVDRASGTLLIRANAEQMKTIDDLVRTVDAAAITSSRRMQMVPIDPAHGSAAEIADALRRLLERNGSPAVEIINIDDLLGEPAPKQTGSVWPISPRLFLAMSAFGAAESGPAVSIAVDPNTNSLVLIGSDRAVTRVRSLLDQVLTQIPKAPGRLRRIELGDRADATRLSRLLTQSLRQVTPPAGRMGDLSRRVSVMADPDTNALLVTATDSDFETVAALIKAVAAPTDDRAAVIKVYPLASGGADRAARHLNGLLQGTSRSLQAGRLRNLAVTLMGGEDEVEATFRPDRVQVSADPRSGSLVVMAPPEAIPFLDRYVELMDQSPVATTATLQIFPLEHANAGQLAPTLRQVLRARFQALRQSGVTQLLPEVTPDMRTNALLVTADAAQLNEIGTLLKDLDEPIGESLPPLRTIALTRARPSQAARLLNKAVVDGRGVKASTTTILADDASGLLLVRADDETSREIDAILAEIDRDATEEYEVRTISLKRADASAVAAALQKLYDDRARIAGGGGRRVTVIGDAAARVLLVAAGDADYAALQDLVKQIDSPASGKHFEIRLFPLEHANARDIVDDVSNMVWELTYGDIWMFDRSSRTAPKDKTVVMHDERLNALVVTGYGDTFDAVEQVIAILDQPESEGYARTIKVFRIGSAPVDMVRDVVNDLYVTQRRWWEAPGQHEFKIRLDAARRLLVVSGTAEEHAKVKDLLAMLEQSGEGESIVRTFALENARASEAVEVLRGTLDLDNRGKTSGLIMQDPEGGEPVAVSARIVADTRANALVVTAPQRSIQVLASLIADIDALSPPGEQSVFIIELANIPPEEAQRVVQAMKLDKETNDNSIASVLSEPMTITPLEGRNAVMVLASPGDHDTITSIFKSIDTPPGEPEAHMRMIDLQNAEASAVAGVLGEMLNPANQQNGSPLAKAVQEQVRRLSMLGEGVHDPDINLDLTQPIRVIAHESQNAILVSSTPPNVAAIAAIVGMLDELPLTDAVTVRIMPLENIAADEFSRIVHELFSQGKRLGVRPGSGIQGVPAGIIGRALLGDVAMTVDERTNTVIVAGTDDAVATVEVLVERLDSQVSSGWLDTQLVMLEFADAEELADLLQQVLIEGADDFPGAASMQKQAGRLRMLGRDGMHVVESDVFRPMHELTIVPHETLNALLIVGSQENLDLAVEMVRTLDIEEASPSATVRFFPLEHASAAHVATTVTRLFDQQVASGVLDREDRISAQPDERTNTLIVTTSNRSFAMLDEILATLDSPLSVDFQEIHLLPLEHATASRMAAIVQRMMDARLDRLRSVEPETADLQRVTVMTDERTNSLIIAAGQDAYEVVQQLVSELDGSELVQRGLVEVIPADRTNASRVAQTINAVMQRRYADVPSNVRSAQIPLVIVDTRSNSLLVSAGPDDLEDIRNLVEKLAAAPTDPAIGLHLLPVNGTAQAERLAPRLQQLMRDRQRSLGEASTPTDRVSIQPDGGTNSLIVAASRENLEVIKGLLEVLQQAEEARGTGRELEVISLQVTSAPAMVEMLDDLYVKEANRLRGNGSIRVTADDRLNAVLVSASAHDIAEIKKLVGRLDGTSPSSVVEIQHVPLASANAIETVRLIEDVLSGRSLGGRRRSDRATVLRYVRQAEGDEDGSEMEVSTALRESINLTPDIRTNTIIIKAPSDSMGLLVDMIRDLDESSVGSKNVRIFKLENADATAMAALLKDLFRLDEGKDLLVLKPRESVDLVDAGSGGMMEEQINISGTELTAVPDPRQQLAITVDSRTNSLIVSGTPAYLDLVQSVIDELDALDANERETFLYQLRNATASDVADVLGDFVETEQQKLIETIGVQQLGSAARLLEREITIRGDDKSNSVLVSASPRYMDRIKGVIQELDVDPPQVLIQVLLAEITLDGGVDWGVDMTKSGGSFTFNMGANGLAAFPSHLLGTLPSMTLGISDFSFVLRALENQGRLHILSNPSIMAANNEAANINVGEIIYVPVGSQTYETGSTNTPLEEKEIGVILSVVPSINPDGYVRMVVRPTFSKLAKEKDEPIHGVETPRIYQRTADTTVTVRDGQTIVIGGLISESYEYREDKVPLLGDIPLLGLLFKSEFEELIRTELVIVLTPHVITSPAAFDRIRELTKSQVENISLPSELLDQIEQGEIEGMGLFNKDGYKLQLRDLEEEIAPEAAKESESP